MPLMMLPTRMVAVKTSKGLVLISPLKETAEHKDAIDALGPVTDVVAPNLFHHLGINAARRAYPGAKFWGVPGFAEKRSDVDWQGMLSEGVWPHEDELALHLIEGMPKVNECVFVHRPTKTLIATDLCFNHVHGKGFGYGVVFRMFGTYKRFAVSRLFTKMAKDRDAVAKSLARLFDEDFDNIVLAHGENVIGGGKDRLRAAFAERGF